MKRSKVIVFALLLGVAMQVQGDDLATAQESAWDALVRDNPSILDDESITPDMRDMLLSTTPEEALHNLGGMPHTIGSNVRTGLNALVNLTTGQHNVAMGVDALQTLTTGVANTAVGRSSLRFTNGFRNTAIGQTAMRDHLSGGNNTAVGDNALRRSTTGTSNTAIGAQSLTNSLSHNNTAVGALALSASTTGFGNIAVGFNAGSAITTGSSNILIGNAGTASDIGTTRIGTDGIHRTTYISGVFDEMPAGATETVVINAAGELGSRPSSVPTVVPCLGGESPATCECPPGASVIGGGGICSAGTHVLDASFPSSPTAWSVSCTESDSGGKGVGFGEGFAPVTSAFAICM